MDDNNSSESKEIEVQLTNEETGGDEGTADTGRTLKLNKSNDSEPVAETADEGDDGSEGAESAEGSGGPSGRRGRNRRQKRREPSTPSANPLSLTELKNKSTQELIDMAREMGLENMARSRKQDIIFALLKKHAKSGEDIWGRRRPRNTAGRLWLLAFRGLFLSRRARRYLREPKPNSPF